jgi:hypothetical protein
LYKKFDFCSEVSVVVVPMTDVIAGVKNFTGNPHDLFLSDQTIKYTAVLSSLIIENAIVDIG